MVEFITTFKSWFAEFQYWREAITAVIGTISIIFLWLRRTRDWLIHQSKWLYSKWPYTIMRQQKAEIARLKNENLNDEETYILQCLWALGIDNSIEIKLVMELLNYNSHKALYALEKLKDKGLIFLSMDFGEGYKLSKEGRNYIVQNGLEISKEEFRGMMDAKEIIRAVKGEK